MNKLLASLLILWSSSSFADELESCDTGSKSGVTPIKLEAPMFPTSPAPLEILKGRVVLELIVDSSGLVKNAKALEAEPRGYFERSAIKTAKRSKFSKSKTRETRCAKLEMVFEIE